MTAPQIAALSHSEQSTLNDLWKTWSDKQFRNELRSTYYDTQNALKSLGISLPPQLERAEAMLGWPAKAVHVLADRQVLDGFVVPGQEGSDPMGIQTLLDENEFDVELPQAVVSALTHSLSFITVTKGDVEAGEPDVQVLARSARHSAALWDKRRRAISAALAVTDTSGDSNVPTRFVMYLPESVIVGSRASAGNWSIDRRPNPLNRVLVAPLRHRPELDRPFGHSRISRAVMGLTDAAIRTFVRAEAGAEFFSVPQRYVLGAEEGAFSGGDKRWKAVMSRMLAIGRDEDGELPQVGQFQQMSMQPHLEQLRSIASLFAGETSVPLSSLGIVQDNPSSAEAIYAAKEDLVIAAGQSNRVMGAALKQVVTSAVMVRDRLDTVPKDLLKVEVKWRNPATPSVVSAADAAVKFASAAPWYADTEVFWEQAGMDRLTIDRLMAEKRKIDARATVVNLAAAASAKVPAQASTEPVGVPVGVG